MIKNLYFSGFIFICIFLVSFFPHNVWATSIPETLSAGFIAKPIWVSDTSPTDGEIMKLFAVVNNISPSTINGNVSFLVDDKVVGVVKVSLLTGAAQITSTEWTAVIGTHNVSATFGEPLDSNGLAVSLSRTIAGPLSITVGAAPPKPQVVQYLDNTVNTLKTVAGPTFTSMVLAADNGRQNAADYFASQINSAPTTTATPGKVLGAETQNKVLKTTFDPAKNTNGFLTVLNRLGYYIFNNPVIFYPLAILFGFFCLWIVLSLSSLFSKK